MLLREGERKLCYQVVNKHDYPASNDFNWMCVFSTKEDAQHYLSYLINEIGLGQENFRIRQVYVELA